MSLNAQAKGVVSFSTLRDVVEIGSASQEEQGTHALIKKTQMDRWIHATEKYVDCCFAEFHDGCCLWQWGICGTASVDNFTGKGIGGQRPRNHEAGDH
jgi:hypothetical protein